MGQVTSNILLSHEQQLATPRELPAECSASNDILHGMVIAGPRPAWQVMLDSLTPRERDLFLALRDLGRNIIDNNLEWAVRQIKERPKVVAAMIKQHLFAPSFDRDFDEPPDWLNPPNDIASKE